MQRKAMNGDQAVALSWKQVEPDVVASYPITPQTIIVETYSEYVANGEVDTEYVCSESEHSAMSICVGASCSGARSATATASAGLAYMWEMLYIAASMRCPIVMTVANRALSGPINIHCDHSDAMGARDSGWIEIFGENVQEAYDNSLISFRVAENMGVRLPVMNCLDGFIITHAIESMTPLEDADVENFVGEFKPVKPLLDWRHPHTYGPFDMPEYYFEHKLEQSMAINGAIDVFKDVAKDYAKVSGRSYDVLEAYRTEDADYVAVSMGSTAGTMKAVVDELRSEGKKVGCVKMRLFRPFPFKDVAKVLEGKKAVAVMDRAISFGAEGAMFEDIRSALYDSKDRPRTYDFIYGLGGRDIGTSDLKAVFQKMMGNDSEVVNYVGVKQ